MSWRAAANDRTFFAFFYGRCSFGLEGGLMVLDDGAGCVFLFVLLLETMAGLY